MRGWSSAWCLLLGACSWPAPWASDDPLESIAQHVVLGHYAAASSRAADLDIAVTALCAQVDATTLAAAREAWWAARAPWKRAEVSGLGPSLVLSERLGPKLDFWPLRAEGLEALIATDGPTDAATFDAMGAATRGYPTVEYLLWADGDQTVARLQGDAHRCAYLVGAAADVAANTRRLQTLWSEGWVRRMGDPADDTGDPYTSKQDVIDAWINQMVSIVEAIRTVKLGKPLGDAAGGLPQPDTLESRYSGRSLDDARDALAGVRDVWTGDVDGPHLGVTDLVDSNPALVTRVDAAFGAAADALSAIAGPLEVSVVDDRAAVVKAQDALRDLQIALQVEVAQALNGTILFSNDGD